MNKETLQEYNTRLAENNTSLDDVLTAINNLPEGGSGGGSSEVYSLEEKRIGTWVDGKPLYRKVILTDTINLSKGNNTLADFDTSYLVKYLQCIFNSDAGQFVLGSNNSDVKHRGNKIETSVTVDWGSGYVEIVVEYTKTTD